MEMEKRGHIGQALRGMMDSSELFCICSERRKSRSHFASRVLALSQGLQKLGLRKGERVVIAALNSDYYLEWLLAVPCAGAIFAPLNYRWSLEEAIGAVQLVQPMILVVDEKCLHWGDVLKSKCASIKTQVFIGNAHENDVNMICAETIIRSIRNPQLELHWAPNGIAVICFTSGTTSTPKGVSLSHNALIVQSLSKLDVVGYSSKDTYLHTAPLCRIGGLSSALAIVMVGGCHVILPKFEASATLEAIRRYNVSAMIVVPAILKDIVESRETRTFPSMATILNGGGSFPIHIVDSVLEMFPSARIFSAYGMTEACSSMTFLQVQPLRQINTTHEYDQGMCVGKPAPHVELRILQGSIIQTRGPHVMDGYWRQEHETEAVLNKDGWLDTGDLGRLDKCGNLWLLGRAKDVIKTGGENVYASQVEAVLSAHPSISTVAVVGIPHKRLSEMVAAVVVLNPGWTWSTSSLQIREDDKVQELKTMNESTLWTHCSSLGLSSYKIPKLIVHSQEALPVTSTGKIKKGVLKSTLLSRSRL